MNVAADRQILGQDDPPPVFIIGGSRTGSEMLKTMLSMSPEIDFVDELFLLSPRWLHKDLWRSIQANVGNLGDSRARQRLVDFIFSGIPYGWVYSVADEKFDRNVLQQQIEDVEITAGNILAALMKAHAERSGKCALGAKFPLHYGYTEKLIDWFPGCKMIHTTRDPRAVYASQANKYLKNCRGQFSRGWMKFRQFIHINIQISWTASIHSRFCHSPNYRLVRYEDLVRDAGSEMRSLCEFLEVEYNDNMLEPEQYGSSYQDMNSRRGINADSMDTWRSKISPLTAGLIWKTHGRARKLMGYDEID